MSDVNLIVGQDGGDILNGCEGPDLIYGFDPNGPQSLVSSITATRVAAGRPSLSSRPNLWRDSFDRGLGDFFIAEFGLAICARFGPRSGINGNTAVARPRASTYRPVRLSG